MFARWRSPRSGVTSTSTTTAIQGADPSSIGERVVSAAPSMGSTRIHSELPAFAESGVESACLPVGEDDDETCVALLLVPLGRPNGTSAHERHLAAYGTEPALDELSRLDSAHVDEHVSSAFSMNAGSSVTPHPGAVGAGTAPSATRSTGS